VTFGRGEDGQLGHGTASDQHTPLVVEAIKGTNPSAVVCGAEYTVAICQGGKEVYSWGWCAQAALCLFWAVAAMRCLQLRSACCRYGGDCRHVSIYAVDTSHHTHTAWAQAGLA
jgi:Regulator of chromosome condensation (RCC1) repeat